MELLCPVMRLMLLLFLIVLTLGAQGQKLSPIQAVRAIDEAFSDAHVAAIEANRATLYIDQCNIAKSFVHANMNEKAIEAYAKGLDIALPNKSHTSMLAEAKRILDLVDMDLVYDGRKDGMDENHQAASRETAVAQESYTQGEAAEKIDNMLAFLHENTVSDPARKSQLIGDLKYCRGLIMEGELPQARDEYHATIIQYLDPRWTSQLLGEIEGILEKTEVINKRAASLRTTQNATGSDDYRSDEADGELESESRIKQAKASGDNEFIAMPTEEQPLLYFKEEVEGRVIERIRLLEDHEMMTYKKVQHNWGKSFYFINEEPTTVTEWLRVWELYQTTK